MKSKVLFVYTKFQVQPKNGTHTYTYGVHRYSQGGHPKPFRYHMGREMGSTIPGVDLGRGVYTILKFRKILLQKQLLFLNRRTRNYSL